MHTAVGGLALLGSGFGWGFLLGGGDGLQQLGSGLRGGGLGLLLLDGLGGKRVGGLYLFGFGRLADDGLLRVGGALRSDGDGLGGNGSFLRSGSLLRSGSFLRLSLDLMDRGDDRLLQLVLVGFRVEDGLGGVGLQEVPLLLNPLVPLHSL